MSDMRIQLVAADLDGTLMGRSLRFSPRMRAAARKLKERGIYFTIATGRIFAEALPYAVQLPITAPLICSQGGCIRSLDSSTPLYEATIPLELAREIILLSREAGWHLHIYVEEMAHTERPIGSEALYRQRFGMQVRIVPDLMTFLRRPPAKFLIITDGPGEAVELGEALHARFDGRLYIVRSYSIFVEGNPLGTSKGQGLARLAEHLGVPQQEVMAIGDQDNDIEMVAWAGLGVAMGNATPSVKASADYIAPSVEEDGAAEAIERFVLR